MNFNSLDELYKRLLPALEMKSREINKVYSEKEIWDYLSVEKWSKSIDLSLADMVADIFKLNIDSMKGKDYYE